jgi:crossover junction endodeoxyribonuclease RuvC
MRVLGVDPGTVSAGYGVVDHPSRRPPGAARPAHALLYVTSGQIQSSRTAHISARLRTLLDRLTAVIQEYAPDCIAIEEPFVDKNIKTALKLGQAEGVAMVAAELAGLPVTVYSPATIKLALTGYGRADKGQIGQMVRRLLRLEAAPVSNHVSDALAVAICHLHSAPAMENIQRPLGKQRWLGARGHRRTLLNMSRTGPRIR